MTEHDFEQQLARLVRARGENAVEAIDPAHVAETAITNAERQSSPLAGLRRMIQMTAQNRSGSMYGLVGAGAVLILVVGFAILAPGIIGPAGSASGSPTPTPSPTPAATVHPDAFCTPLDISTESLTVGRYCLDAPFPVKVTFDVPSAGWTPWLPTGDLAALLNGTGWGLAFAEIDNVYTDPCHPDAGLLDPPLGSTPEDLVAALVERSGYAVSEAKDVSIGGYAGVAVEVSATYDAGACPDAETSWGVTPAGFSTDGSMVPTPERPIWLWVGDVEGTRLVVTHPLSALPSVDEWAAGIRAANRHAADLTELDSMLQSIHFND